MTTPTQPRRRFARGVAIALIGSMLTPQWATLAYGASTPLADVPIAAKVTAKPNIVYTVDDSGSMSNTYLPDFTVLNYCRGGTGTSACSVSRNNNTSNFYDPPFYASDFNHLTYDPNVTYQPPVKADALPLTYSIGTITDNQGNQNAAGTFKKIQTDPYLSPASTQDLSGKVTVPLYCNSDWPLDLSIDANGQYNAAKGKDCRINGTKYDQMTFSDGQVSPAVDPDYNYPWQNNAGPNDAKYFFSQSGTRPLWCDKTSALWPTVACATYCPAGVPTKTTITPTWTPTTNRSSCCTGVGTPVAGCPGASTYSPASCNTSTLYCSPGLGKPGECTSGCTCNQQVVGRNGTCTYVDPTSGETINTGNKSCDTGAGCTATCNDVQIITGCSIGVPSSECAASTGYCNAYLKGSTTTTLLDDANLTNGGTGTVCRHNNQAYGVTAAGPVTYSTVALGGLAPWNTKVNSNASATNPNPALKWGFKASGSNCQTMGTTTTIPRHYYVVDSVRFCNSTVTADNDKWRGFGTSPCPTEKNDLTTYRHVQYGKFTRYDLINDGRTFPYTDPVTGAPGARTYAEEVRNYANWFAYYRTRILATKTTSAIAFSYLDDTYRVGFQNLGSEMPPDGVGADIKWVDVDDFKGTVAGTTRYNWYNTLFGINVTTYTTPIMNGMLRVGDLFENGGTSALPSMVTPLPTPKDPIALSCQSNYHILFTDGFTNQAKLPTVAGNQDKTIPNWTGITQVPHDQVLTNLVSGANWPKPFAETPPTMSDTLADIATYYWARDLRPSLKNDVPAHSGKSGGDIDPAKDVAWWQHVNFNAISFGSEGVLDAVNQKTTLDAITAGSQVWTRTTPNPNQPTNPPGNPGASAVDDLWHATVMARGQFVYARNPLEVATGLSSILNGIQNQRVSWAGAAFTGQVLDATNNIMYQTTIEPGWAGDLLKVKVDPKTGDEISTLWQAGEVLKTQLTPATASDEPWFTNRKVVTVSPATGKGIPFRHDKLTAGQLASLSPDATRQQKMIAYLRGGDRFNAGAQEIEGAKMGQFRLRSGKLGDISNAQAVVAEKPGRPYLDATDPGYSAFVTAQSARAELVFAAANDGMLHAFNVTDGKEAYAFIPGALFRGDASSVATQDVTGIQALTYQDGGVPIFKHRFYVDSSPRIADVNFGGGPDDWHTIIVGGLGKGGNTYYALDITQAGAADETAAAAKVLWEWRNPDNDDIVDGGTKIHRFQSAPGYTYGRPVIVKTRAFGWVVIVTSGYNNASGLGKLYFLDPKTGTLLKTLTTSAGSGTNPSGLAQIHAFVKDYRNQIAEQVYGGDLLGNLWRFDVSDPDPGAWSVELFAKLTDPNGSVQPITTAPQIEIDINNGVDRYVLIGTGRLLDTSDLTTPDPPQTQTMYAIRDGTVTAYMASGLPVKPRDTLEPINADGKSAIVGGAPNGWYHDLPSADPTTAQRIVVDVQADINIAAYIGTQAPNDPCIISLPASLYARDYTSARSLIEQGGSVVASVTLPEGAVGGMLVGRIDPVTGAQSLGWLISTGIPGSKPFDIVNPVTGPGNRLSWRLLTGQQ